jgi:hypothetical protein
VSPSSNAAQAKEPISQNKFADEIKAMKEALRAELENNSHMNRMAKPLSPKR